MVGHCVYDQPVPQDLGRSAARGALATAASQGVRVVLQIVSLSVLARLLLPSDYGLVAMALAVIGIGHLVRDMGLYSAAVRAESLSEAQRDNLFWINTGLGVVLAALCCASGPLLAAAFGRDELVGIALWLAPTFVLSGMGTQYRANLIRDMRFAAVATCDVISQGVSVLVAVVIASMGGGYWALVAQHSVSGAAFLVMVVFLGRWLPGRYRRDAEIKPLLGLGASVMVSSLLTYVSYNLDAVVIGGRFGADAVGLYNRGSQLVRSTLKQVSSPVGAVALPIMGRLQNEPVRLINFAHKVQIAVGYPTAFAVSLIIALPSDVVRIALGDGWHEANPIVVWMAVAVLMAVVTDVASLLMIACGAAGALAKVSLSITSANVVGVLVGVTYGIEGVAIGMAVAAVVCVPLSLIVLARATLLPVAGVAWGVVRLTGAMCVAALLAHLVCADLAVGSAGRLLVAALVSAGSFLALVVIVPVRRDFQSLVQMGRAALRR